MSIETYERIMGKFELYKLLDEGINDVRNNRVLPAEDVFNQVESGIKE